MLTVQNKKIIIRRYQFDHSERKIARELQISRTAVRRYLGGYERAREELLSSEGSGDGIKLSLSNTSGAGE